MVEPSVGTTGHVFHVLASNGTWVGPGVMVGTTSVGSWISTVTAMVSWGICVTAAVDAGVVTVEQDESRMERIKKIRNFTVYLQLVEIACAILTDNKDSPEGVRWMALFVNSFMGIMSQRSRYCQLFAAACSLSMVRYSSYAQRG